MESVTLKDSGNQRVTLIPDDIGIFGIDNYMYEVRTFLKANKHSFEGNKQVMVLFRLTMERKFSISFIATPITRPSMDRPIKSVFGMHFIH